VWYSGRMAHKAREVVVGDRGRLVLPSDIRAELGLEPGTRMLLSTDDDGSLHLRPYRAVAEKTLGMLADLAPADVSMVDELISERRQEAAREDSE
jgi:AbrB family looped-hinge helix DNA binding protein